MKKLILFVLPFVAGLLIIAFGSGCAIISPQYPPGTMMYDQTGQLVPVPQTIIVAPWYANLPDANHSVGYWGSGYRSSGRIYRYDSGRHHSGGGGHRGGGSHHGHSGGGRH